MKIVSMALLLIVAAGNVQAQTWEEIIRQKQTQTKYLLQQIAGLQVYIELAGKGYHTAQSGLELISDIKNGDLNLHSAFFKGLKTVNPLFKQLPEIAEIIAGNLTIIKGCANELSSIRKHGYLHAGETAYLDQLYGKLKKDCTEVLDQTFAVLTDNDAEINDAARLHTLGQLSRRMRDNVNFYRSFSADSRLLAAHRERELRDVEVSFFLHVLPKH